MIKIDKPRANPADVMHEYGLECHNELDFSRTSLRPAEGVRNKPIDTSPSQKFDAIVLGVAHKEFLNIDLTPLKKEIAVVYDVKGVLGAIVDGKL